MGRRPRGSTRCPQDSGDPRPVAVQPVRTPSTVVWSVLATPCLALPFFLAMHGVMIPQPAGFEMSSKSVHTSNCGCCQVRYLGKCTIAAPLREALRATPPRGLHDPCAPVRSSAVHGRAGLYSADRSGDLRRHLVSRSHREGSGTGPWWILACHGVRVFTIALRMVRNLRMAAVMATFCAFPRASSR